MNCKPGDLAMIVSIESPYHRGKIVTVVRVSNMFDDSWVCDPDLEDAEGVGIDWADCALRPIRPTDGEDETLQWAGKPNEVTA